MSNRIGLLSQFEVGQWYERWEFFAFGDVVGKTQCQLCGKWIGATIQAGNALAKSSHLRAHTRKGILVEDGGRYQPLAVPEHPSYHVACGAHGCGESETYPTAAAARIRGWYFDSRDGYGWVCPSCNGELDDPPVASRESTGT